MNDRGRSYVEVVYSETLRPLTEYPGKLARYLAARYQINAGSKLLDVGCGRGEVLRGFIASGVQGFGVDQSVDARKYCPDADLRLADLGNEPLPYDDDTFDFIYSKSVLEHFYYPEKLVREMFRVLKPGGTAIALCPDWEFNMRNYFEDFTHRTPFTLPSLRDIHIMTGFDRVMVERFRQLPILWSAWGNSLRPLAWATRVLAPDFLKPRSKWVRFCKEIMLLSSARKAKVQA